MSRYASADGLPRIHVGAGPIANMASPTMAEIGTLTNLSGFLTKDGMARAESGGRAPASGAAEQYNLDVAGSVTLNLAMTFFRDNDADTAWTTIDRGDWIYVVFASQGGSGANGAIAAGDPVEVYYGQVLDKSMADTAENTVARFTTNLSTGAAPEMNAIVADDSSSS